MDSTKKYDRPSPEESSNPLSKLFFIWIIPFFKYGYSNDLEIKDLYNCSKTEKSGKLGENLEKLWIQEVKAQKENDKKPSLLRVIRKAYIVSYSFYGIFVFFQSIVLKMLQPIVLSEYIKYYDVANQATKEPANGWLLAAGVLVIVFLSITTTHFINMGMQRVGMRCRIGICSLIYRKLLKLKSTSMDQVPIGKLVNLLSNDVQRFDIASNFLHYIWIMPIQTVIAAYIMYSSVGLATIAGLGALILQSVFLQGYLSRLQGRYRAQIAQKTDNRVKLMNEITAGIQVIKMYAWERPFEQMVALARKHEIDIVSKTSYIRGLSLAMMVFTERATLFLTITAYVLLGNRLTGAVVFSMAQLFNTVQLYMSIFYPLAISTYAEAKTSVRRIEEFLLLDENAPAAPPPAPAGALDEKSAVCLRRASASWTPNPIVNTLIELDLSVRPGALCCVVGGVGAGKSSLLQVLLHELPLLAGLVRVNGSVAYAAQEPWLFGATIKNNILFGEELVRKRYKEVVRVCALERDFELFAHGDRTTVGEKGAGLSGGQRARVNLARAVYREADVYLFDDPLSAVDAHVGRHLFQECIVGYLRGKTRVLVTHQLQFLRQADLIVVMNNGRIEKVGAFSDLTESELASLNQHQSEEHLEEKVDTPVRSRLTSVTSKNSTIVDEDDDEEAEETQELVEKGAIASSTYLEYFKSGGSWFTVALLFFLLLIAQLACNASDLYLTYWTNIEELKWNQTHHDVGAALEALTSTENSTTIFTTTQTPSDLFNFDNYTTMVPSSTELNSFANSDAKLHFQPKETYITIYTILIVLSIVLMSARSVLFFKICMTASRNLHNTMFANVLQATMRFFDTNPSGRILNRFSKDMGAVDEILPRAILETLQVFLVMCGILGMVFNVTPWMIAPAILLGGLFYWFRIIYVRSAQDVKRLEGITRAPVFSHVSATVYGLPTIRACRAQPLITAEFDHLQDAHTASAFLFLALSEAFGFFLDLISGLFLAVVTFQFLLLADAPSASVGLAISQSLILTGMLQYGVRQSAEVASNMTSVERVLQYTKLPKEGPFVSLPTKRPPAAWPPAGRISFQRVNLTYVPGEGPVLKDLNLEIAGGEKVGIVGRTGAGKSTLIASLFRLSPIEGAVVIDELNTAFIGLTDLRSKISIIPQEPVLFSNTVRYNLDPFGRCSDAQLWSALERVELKTTVESLEQRVSEGGANFSAGQRQLVCLARAIVRGNRVLVMDEATANVDPATDALIQRTIRRSFAACTVLTIAHRLDTVMDADRVLVMDAGRAVEFGRPHELLQAEGGYFARMVSETGAGMEGKLRRKAEESFQRIEEEDGVNQEDEAA